MKNKNIATKMLTLISREYWEHKIIMLWLPVGITLITLVLQSYATLTSFTASEGGAENSSSGFSYTYQQSRVEDNPTGKTTNSETTTMSSKNFTASEFLLTLLGRNKAGDASSPLDAMLIGFSFPIIALLILSLLTYCHSCLYGDRARKEILFWRSMPVSETQNLLCKLLVIIIVIPTIYCMMILVYGAGALLLKNLGGENWVLLFLQVSQITIASILFTLVFIPLISWILFCSAAARRAPVFLSLLLPLALGMVLKFSLGTNHITSALSDYFNALWSQVKMGPEMLQQLATFFISAEYLTALALAIALLLAAVWLRNYRYEI